MDYSIPEDTVQNILSMKELNEPPDNPARVNGRGGNPDYQDYIRDNDCVSCIEMGALQEMPTQHHHAFTAGTALRCPDEYGIPLCADCHSMFHSLGKKTFLKRTGLPNYYAPVILFLANYCENRKSPNRYAKRRAVYYFKRIYSWIKTEKAKTIIKNERSVRKIPEPF